MTDWWRRPVEGWRQGWIDMRNARTDETVRVYLREQDAWRNQHLLQDA